MDDTPFAASPRSHLQPSSGSSWRPSGSADVGVGYLPAPGQTARVGGDWVDTVRCDGGSTAFMIGDVMGHGPHLAGRSHVAGTILATALRDSGPAAALHQLDLGWRAVTTFADTMATACVLTATPLPASTTPAAGHLRRVTTTRTAEPEPGWLLRWSSAGHPTPLLLAPDGSTSTLTPEYGDLPIGVDPTRPRHEHTTVVPHGTTVLMFTDGVIEQRRPSAGDGLAHLTALATALGRGHRLDSAVTADRLLAARAPLLDTGDESTLLVAHLDTHHDIPLDVAA